MKLLPAAAATAAGVAAQTIAFALATADDPQWGMVVVLLLAGIAIAGWPLLRHAGPTRRSGVAVLGIRPADAALVVGVGLFLPVLGLAGLGVVLYLRGLGGPRKSSLGVVETEAPRLSGGPLQTDQAGRFGPGSLEGILRHSPSPDLRMRVVLACRQLPGRLAVPLLRLALRDRVDDVRLLAYAVLDQRERAIQTEIQDVLLNAGTQDPNATNLPARAHRRLCELYFELAYQGLVEGELMSFSLEQVMLHALAVLKGAPGNPRMALLAGRSLILLKRYGEAGAMLEEALRRGLPDEVVGPYLAEVAYEQRRPDDVRAAVARFAASARLRPTLAMMVERWS